MILFIKNYICVKTLLSYPITATLQSNTCILGIFTFRADQETEARWLTDYGRVGGKTSGSKSSKVIG